MHNSRMTVKVLLLAACCSVIVATTSASAQQKKPEKGPPATQRNAERKSMSDQPLVCNLFGLTAAERLRQQELHKQLFSQAASVRELSNGYAVSFPATKENILGAAEFISLERVCCSFFHFDLEVGSQDEPVWLRITGGQGVKEFLKSEFHLK